ncbi:MAG: hypothetical protein K6U12_11580 [Armatimonadetes bacterium]|nr:hypothetical protein [Armatimonadota bacterium]
MSLLSKPHSPTSPAREQPIVNRPNHMTRQISFITWIARLPARQVQQVAQPIPNVFRQPACEPIAPASCKVRGVVDKIQPRRVGMINRVVPALPIEVRVALRELTPKPINKSFNFQSMLCWFATK